MAVHAPRRMSREARREALLDAAQRVLRHHALAELSFELVADEAGVSKTLPYSYFDSAGEIAAALYRRVVGAIDAATDDIIASVDTLDERLRRTLDLWCDAIERDGRVVQSLLDGGAVAAVRPLIDARDANAVVVWSAALCDEYHLDEGDAAFLADMLTSGATAALSRWALEGLVREDVIARFVRATRAMAEAFDQA